MSNETSTSSDSSEDLRLVRSDDKEQQPRRNEDMWRGKPKLVCPTFDGIDPNSWLSRVNQYFDLNNVKKTNKVQYAAYYLKGEANSWWQWISSVYYVGEILRKRLWCVLGHLSIRTMIRLCLVLNKMELYVNIRKNLNALPIEFAIDRRRHSLGLSWVVYGLT